MQMCQPCQPLQLVVSVVRVVSMLSHDITSDCIAANMLSSNKFSDIATYVAFVQR